MLYPWAYVRNCGERKLIRLEEQLQRCVIVPFDNELCKQWASIRRVFTRECAASALGVPMEADLLV